MRDLWTHTASKGVGLGLVSIDAMIIPPSLEESTDEQEEQEQWQDCRHLSSAAVVAACQDGRKGLGIALDSYIRQDCS